jgi:hypothetical protein
MSYTQEKFQATASRREDVVIIFTGLNCVPYILLTSNPKGV